MDIIFQVSIIRQLRNQANVTQQELAKLAGTSQSTIAAYETHVKSPTLRTIENLADSLGLQMVVNYMPPLTREDRRSLAFHRAIARILIETPTPLLERAQHNLNKLSSIHPDASTLLERWRGWMGLSPEELACCMLDPFPLAREMRHVSPFSGVLTQHQRAQILREFRRETDS